ncbi:MAG: FecR domain-containing protein [Pseudomonadota bacterium]
MSQVAQCRRPKRTKFWFGLAAACAAAVFVAFPELNIRLSADHLTAVGEKARVELPDGSIAWLNTNTAIDVQYQPEQRQIVLLQGEARFEVARERDRPFQVLADSGQSRALGTVFSVSEVGESVVVSVIEGRVEVTSSTGSGDLWHDNTAKKAVLGLDQQVSYFPDGELSSVREFDSSKSDSWRNGYLSIRNLAFERAVEEIERYHPARILLLADKNNLGPVTARLSIKDIDSGLDAIAATQGLTVTKIGGFLIVLR